MKSVIDIDVLGSYNTVKATLPYLLESAAKHRTDGRTRKCTPAKLAQDGADSILQDMHFGRRAPPTQIEN